MKRYKASYSINDKMNSIGLNIMPKVITASFTEPYLWYTQFVRATKNDSIKYECSICCDVSMPFIILRKKINKRKLYEFDLRPLDYFYPEFLCNKCADYFCHNKIDPVRVKCIAALPLINLNLTVKEFCIEMKEILGLQQIGIKLTKEPPENM